MAKKNKGEQMSEIENVKYEVAQEMGLPQKRAKRKKGVKGRE